MVKHFIVVASAYSIGKRIALDYSSAGVLRMDEIQKDLDYILKSCGKDVPISTHYVQTNNFDWGSVVTYDDFFSKAELVKSKEEFIEILKKDRELNGLDIAKYILSKVPCTHLKLEKLLYMCYADYLCEYNDKLFLDKIYAYKLGPVIESVYLKYKKSGSGYLSVEDDVLTYDEKEKTMPIRSRILSSRDGLKKIISIDKTLDKYASYSASELVKLTHRKLSPWEKSGSGNLTYEIISDDLILKYHRYEEI